MVAILLTPGPGILLAKDIVPFLLNGSYLAASLLVAAGIIALVRRWWRGEQSRPHSASDEMAHYRRLYEQGNISEEEYRRLRTLLGGELRRSADLLPVKAPQAPVEGIVAPPLLTQGADAPRSPGENSPGGPSGPPPEEPKPPPAGIKPA
jgi:hypothetical protein